jgi:hypothetical protein
MPLPQYVEWRGNRLWYRRAYPKLLWPVVGNGKTFARSLRTDSPSEAERSRPEAERAFFAAVDVARAELARRSDRSALTREAAESLAVKWFLETLEGAEDFDLPRSPDALGDALELSAERAADARQALAEGDPTDWRKRAADLRERGSYSSEPAADALLLRLLGRASVALEEVTGGRLVGDYGKRPTDPLFAAAMEAPKLAPASPASTIAPSAATPSANTKSH